eukprot:1193171-Prorocentrum_minimum.AAC.4
MQRITTAHPSRIGPLSGASKSTWPSTVVSTSAPHTATVLVMESEYSTLSATRMPPVACSSAMHHTSPVHPSSRTPSVSTQAMGR